MKSIKEKGMSVMSIPLVDITPSKLNPRKLFDQESLNELAESIKENGLLQPITVRERHDDNGKYEIVCGERRYRSCVIAGLECIQAIVRDLDDRHALAVMVIENLQRKDVDVMEEAAALSKVYHEGGMHVNDIAKMLGKSSSFVTSRIQLAQIIPQFEQLMRDGTLYLTHLLTICKLTKEQQETLYADCFTPECVERWTRKILRLDTLAGMIDERVMKSLNAARFNPHDESYSCGKSCDGCLFNTKNKGESYGDANKPRCMDARCFNRKTLEAAIRSAKESGLRVVCKGGGNDGIVAEAVKSGLSIGDVSQRSYVLEPVRPDAEKFSDEEAFRKRMNSYKHVKAVFDGNIVDGVVEKVFELCFDGHVSGEVKYVYFIPQDASMSDAVATERKQLDVSRLKEELSREDDKEHEELVERKRQLLNESSYETNNSMLSADENVVLLALMLKRLPLEFKKKMGFEWMNSERVYKENAKLLESCRNGIKRQFIKSCLSDKSVNYSNDLAGLLDMVTSEAYRSDALAIEVENTRKYRHRREQLKEKIKRMLQKETDSNG